MSLNVTLCPSSLTPVSDQTLYGGRQASISASSNPVAVHIIHGLFPRHPIKQSLFSGYLHEFQESEASFKFSQIKKPSVVKIRRQWCLTCQARKLAFTHLQNLAWQAQFTPNTMPLQTISHKPVR